MELITLLASNSRMTWVQRCLETSNMPSRAARSSTTWREKAPFTLKTWVSSTNPCSSLATTSIPTRWEPCTTFTSTLIFINPKGGASQREGWVWGDIVGAAAGWQARTWDQSEMARKSTSNVSTICPRVTIVHAKPNTSWYHWKLPRSSPFHTTRPSSKHPWTNDPSSVTEAATEKSLTTHCSGNSVQCGQRLFVVMSLNTRWRWEGRIAWIAFQMKIFILLCIFSRQSFRKYLSFLP